MGRQRSGQTAPFAFSDDEERVAYVERKCDREWRPQQFPLRDTCVEKNCEYRVGELEADGRNAKPLSDWFQWAAAPYARVHRLYDMRSAVHMMLAFEGGVGLPSALELACSDVDLEDFAPGRFFSVDHEDGALVELPFAPQPRVIVKDEGNAQVAVNVDEVVAELVPSPDGTYYAAFVCRRPRHFEVTNLDCDDRSSSQTREIGSPDDLAFACHVYLAQVGSEGSFDSGRPVARFKVEGDVGWLGLDAGFADQGSVYLRTLNGASVHASFLDGDVVIEPTNGCHSAPTTSSDISADGTVQL